MSVPSRPGGSPATNSRCRVKSVLETNPNSPKAILSVAMLAFAIAAVFIVLPMLLGVNLWWVIAPLAVLAAVIRFTNWRRGSADLNPS